MPNLPECGYPTLISKLQDVSAKTVKDARTSLLERNIQNPVPPPKIKAPVDMDGVIESLPEESRPSFIRHMKLIDAIRDSDQVEIDKALMAMELAGEIRSSDSSKISDGAKLEIDDPSWPTQISWCESVYGRQLTDDELTKGLLRVAAKEIVGSEISLK